MKISIIGSGNMGQGLARLLSAKHEVTLVSRQASADGAKLPGVASATYADGVSEAEVVFFALPYEGVSAAAEKLGDLAGKLVVDITNPLTADYMGLTLGYSTSAGEQIAALFPQAKVVKAFNTIFAPVLALAAQGAKSLPTVLIAGDDADAKETVRQLATDMGFSAVIAGPLSTARYLEPLGGLQIRLAYAEGHGAEVGFTFGPVA
ncbi:NADPH-dependent F420 reductase [Actomonas aquatica]|uniref:NADPH-dependent F420 reductase n=1 Tax=Actomonas aquatica TaxID=2866162 RepID=A0ABZ1CBU7_9BACT|nr:NADPH-dependent F420 reductase [Opitutus sp. WL0086]WRQ88921.1 NADPH-dependent F420 reductase [Opitutus sp. WL0086]